MINVARIADRYGVSDTAAAALASAAYVDAGLGSEDNTRYVIDPSKLHRARLSLHRASSEGHSKTLVAEPLHAFFYDGRKDKTKKYEYGRIKEKEHIAIVREPGSSFLSHISPEGNSAQCIMDAILERFAEKNVDTTTIKAVGSDGTNTNTGRENNR